MKKLVYTSAFDRTDSDGFRATARLLCLSLRESGHDDEIPVITKTILRTLRTPAPQHPRNHRRYRAPIIDGARNQEIFQIDCNCPDFSDITTAFASKEEITAVVESREKITVYPFRTHLAMRRCTI